MISRWLLTSAGARAQTLLMALAITGVVSSAAFSYVGSQASVAQAATPPTTTWLAQPGRLVDDDRAPLDAHDPRTAARATGGFFSISDAVGEGSGVVRSRLEGESEPHPGSLRVQAKAAALTADLTVTKTADTNDGTCDGDCSLREAIAVAASGDVIDIPSGIYSPVQRTCHQHRPCPSGCGVVDYGHPGRRTGLMDQHVSEHRHLPGDDPKRQL